MMFKNLKDKDRKTMPEQMRISLKTEIIKRSHNEIRKLKRKITKMRH